MSAQLKPNQKYLFITAKKLVIGHAPAYQLRDNNDEQIADEGAIYDTRAAAHAALRSMYPSGSVWQPVQAAKGYRIFVA
jgi:hypothetical protein